MQMKLMIVGLGLIGGSMAMALKNYPGLECTAITRNPVTRAEALRLGIIRSAWALPGDAPIESQDILMLCLPPDACVDFIRTHSMRMRPGSILTDVCGVKRPLKEAIDALPGHPFHYLGGHPMAGKERGSFANATPDLYRGAHYILVPDADVPQEAVHEMQQLIQFIGCADTIITTPEEHDARIGYTSQLMHVMALALCDQHLLFESYGFEGGSFRGATRVAALDPDLVLLTADLPAHKKLKEELSGLGYDARAIDIESFDDYSDIMKEFTGMTGREDLYKKNCTDVKARIDDLTAGKEDAFSDVSYLCIRVSATKNKALKKDSFACEIISGFGAKNIADDDEALDELSLEEIASQDPDYFFVAAMGDEEEARESFEQTFASQGVFNELRSVKEGHLIFLPKDLFQNKPNARWDEAYKYIYEVFSEE